MASTQVTPTRMELTKTKRKLVTAVKGPVSYTHLTLPTKA